jgi:hypothetical protein
MFKRKKIADTLTIEVPNNRWVDGDCTLKLKIPFDGEQLENGKVMHGEFNVTMKGEGDFVVLVSHDDILEHNPYMCTTIHYETFSFPTLEQAEAFIKGLDIAAAYVRTTALTDVDVKTTRVALYPLKLANSTPEIRDEELNKEIITEMTKVRTL